MAVAIGKLQLSCFTREQQRVYRTAVHPGRNVYRHPRGAIQSMTDRAAHIDAFRAAAVRCPLPLAIELIGEKWALLIVRAALNGLVDFDYFQAGLGIARNVLSNRLGKLVAGGILERTPAREDRRKIVYSLTAKGEALLPVVLALRQWSADWGHGRQERILVDRLTDQPVRRMRVLGQDGRELGIRDLKCIEQKKPASTPLREAVNA
jgi:DNA-binding HxlR family transcriptional regulator